MPRARHTWSDHSDALLRQHYPMHTAADCATALGCSVRAIYNRAATLGITKDPAFHLRPASGRLDSATQRGASTRFKAGGEPWNKGQPFQAGGRSHETRFRKGRPAHEARNYVPIGTERINVDGYLERKTTDDQSIAPARRWAGVHRLVWEAANGPVPAGHAVVFLPGRRSADPEAITLDALELVSRAELMSRNNLHNTLPPELRQLAHLRGQLTRRIRRKETAQ